VIRVDPVPGFVSLKNTNALQLLNSSIKVGRVKNTNKNPVAERAVLELEEELLRQEPGGGPVTELGLAIATACPHGSFGHNATGSPMSRYLSMTYSTS